LISVSAMSLCVDASSSRLLLLGSASQNGDTGCRVGKEALLMRDDKPQRHTPEERSPSGSPCQIDHLFDGAPCVEAAKEKVDGLLLCERHALEARLEG
jgi:hypothetical protein